MSTPQDPLQPRSGEEQRILSASFSGPVPLPSILAQYEEICPGSADRMIGMAEEEGHHRRRIDAKLADANIEAMRRQFSEARWGQILAFLVSVTFLGVGAYLTVSGQPWVGGILGSMGISTIVASFIRGRSQPSNEGQQSKPRKQKDQKR